MRLPSSSGVPEEVRDSYRRSGLVSDATLSGLVGQVGRRSPSRLALVEGNSRFDGGRVRRLVGAVAGCLRAHGIGPGDVVTWQLPTWWEAYVVGLAIWQVGAVSNPIVSLSREHELRQMLPMVTPAAVITSGDVRGFDHAAAMSEVLLESGLAPRLKMILRASTPAPSWVRFEDVLAWEPARASIGAAADDPCLVLFTSGTTSAPKAAVHSSRSLLAETNQLIRAWGLGRDDVGYMPAPLSHVTGVLMALTVPVVTGGASVLTPRWDAERAVREINQHRVTYSAGATIFLRELTEAAAREPLPSMRIYGCGGAPVPRAVMEASEACGIPAVRVYGMTELPTVTLGNASVPFDRRADTDGMIAEGVEVLAVDRGRPLGSGAEGELLVRGPEQMLGYLSEADNRATVTDDGWIRTGDLGVVNDGFVTISGRLKDIINRGGEKFASRDIEDGLLRHPRVQQAAVVPAPDPRFGEVPAAFLVLSGPVATGDLVDHLAAAGLPRQKIPAHWRVVTGLPTTPSGKIKKYELTQRLEEELQTT